MWDILDIICGIGECFASWRFFICVLLTVALVALIHYFVSSQTVFLGISIPVAIIVLGFGIVWEWRKT